MGKQPQGTRINSVARAARLLVLIATLPPDEATVQNIATSLSISVPTAYHMLNTLLDARLLSRDDAKRYHLGLHVGFLGEAYRRQAQPPPELMDALRGLSEATGESCFLSQWHEGSIEISAQVAGSHAVQVAHLQPGFQDSAHARASGKVLLAYTDPRSRASYLASHQLTPITPRTITDPVALQHELNAVLRNGYAVEEEEFSLEVACVSVPVIAGDLLFGAYTVAAPVSRYETMKETYLGLLQAAARQATASVVGVLDDEVPLPDEVVPLAVSGPGS